MGFFIAQAQAQQGGGGAEGGGLSFMIMMLIFIAVFYFFLLRPQAKRAKEHQKMVSSLAKGDEVVTNGGILGKVIELGDNYVLLEVADGVNVKIQRHAIGAMLPKGTMKDSL